MPLATINLISLSKPSELSSLVQHIKSSKAAPLVLSKPIRWVIRPENIDPSSLLKPRWDLLLILEDNKASQDLITSILNNSSTSFKTTDHWTCKAGVPSRLTKDFERTNSSLLHPQEQDVPSLSGALDEPLLNNTSQDLSLSPELQSWIGASPSSLPVKGAVSMLNLLSFNSGMKESYLKYGKAFGETIGAKRGGNAKLVGNIVHPDQDKSAGEKEGIWHEFALAHYPSLLHFADMLASKDYQEVNQKHRVSALGDTCILCTSELEIENMSSEGKQEESGLHVAKAAGKEKAKL